MAGRLLPILLIRRLPHVNLIPKSFCVSAPNVLNSHRKIDRGYLPAVPYFPRENDHYKRFVKIDGSEPYSNDTSELPAELNELYSGLKSGVPLEDQSNRSRVMSFAKSIADLDLPAVKQAIHILSESSDDPLAFNKNKTIIWTAIDDYLIKYHKKSVRTTKNLFEMLNMALKLQETIPLRVPRILVNVTASIFDRLKIMDLDKNMLLSLMYALNVSRSKYPSDNLHALELKIASFIGEMSVEEVGLVCAALFKSATKLRDPELIHRIVAKVSTREQRKPASAIAMCSILKALRHQILPGTIPRVREFIDNFSQEELDNMPPMYITHLCRCANAYHKYRPEILDTAIRNLSESLLRGDSLRFKDVVETIRACDDFSHSPDSGLINHIMSVYPSREEIFEFPAYFITYLSLLASRGYYSEKLIEICFSEAFLKHANEKCRFFPYVPLLTLHTVLSINCHPKFSGKLLSRKQVDDFVRQIGRVDLDQILDRRTESETFTAHQMKRLFWFCKQKFNDRCVYAFILPHMTFPDIIILPKDKDVMWLKTRTLIRDAFSGCTIIQLETRQHFADSNTIVPRNFFTTKNRLLDKLGFEILPVHFSVVNNASNRVLDQMLSKVE